MLPFLHLYTIVNKGSRCFVRTNRVLETIVYPGALGGRGARESLYMEFCSRAGLEVWRWLDAMATCVLESAQQPGRGWCVDTGARAARFDVPACPRDAAATRLRMVDTGARAACFDGPRPAVSSRCCGHWVEDGGRQS